MKPYMVGTHWARNLKIAQDDIEYLTNILLEKETPLTIDALALLLIERRIQQSKQVIEDRYKNVKQYNPALEYATGDRVLFTQMEYETATVTDVRDGQNPDYGDFKVIQVKFDSDEDVIREFAAALKGEHKLNEVSDDDLPGMDAETASAEDILKENRASILTNLRNELQKSTVLTRVGGFWFIAELVIEADIGVLHLAEAVLDMHGGGPMSPKEILEQIGGMGDAPIALQEFSLNLALNDDDRFDEVGPAGEIQWYLNRMEPELVREVPRLLKHQDIPYDEDILSDEMIDLETVLDDEWTPIEFEGNLKKATTLLIYPHRRSGTLPLNAKTSQIFPSARTPRIHVTFVDEADGETFSGWVVHDHKYVYGLEHYYSKHHLPIGCFISVEHGENPGEIIVSHDGYKPRTEWIRVVVPSKEHIQFENKKRAIGATFDELVIVGVDDLKALDELVDKYRNKTLASILKDTLSALGKLSPQGSVHATTLYSAVNLLRRCAPGPLFAILAANPDFDSAGGHYWKLSE